MGPTRAADGVDYHYGDFGAPATAPSALWAGGGDGDTSVYYPSVHGTEHARLIVPVVSAAGAQRATYANLDAQLLEVDATALLAKGRGAAAPSGARLPPYARPAAPRPPARSSAAPAPARSSEAPAPARSSEAPARSSAAPGQSAAAAAAAAPPSYIAAISGAGAGAGAPAVEFHMRDALFLLLLVVALSYMAYLTHVGARDGHADYVFALARTLSGEHARAVVFEFPLTRLLLARLNGSLALLAACIALPLSLACLVLIRVAGRFVIALSCTGALGALLVVAARAAAFFFALDRVALAFLCVVAAFTALILLYMLYGWRQALFAFGRLFEEAAAIVLCALPGLCAATFILGLLYVAFVAWWALTLAALVTTDVSVIVAAAAGGAAEMLGGQHEAAAADVLRADAAPAVVFVGGAAAPVYFCILLFLWVSNIFNGVLRVAVAGGARAWQRQESASLGVMTTLGRALTLSLGSIALASLIVSLVEFSYMVVDRVRATAKRVGVPFAASLIKIALVVLSSVLRFVNSYVYVEIAASGLSFFDANSRVFARFRSVPSKALLGYASASYVLMALRCAISFIAVLVGALLRAQTSEDGRPLPLAAVLSSRAALVAYAAAYLVSALPTSWLETSAHARLVLEMESVEDGGGGGARTDPSVNA